MFNQQPLARFFRVDLIAQKQVEILLENALQL